MRDEAEGAILLQIRDRYLAGWPTVEICRDLHRRGIAAPGGGATWSTDGLLKVLRNPIHAGLVAHREELLPGAHAAERYWSPEDREYLMQRISGRADRLVRSRAVHDYPLSGVLYCEHCGRRLTGSMDMRKHRRQYSCNSPRTEGEHHSHLRGRKGQPRVCPGVHLGAAEVEQAVRQAVSELARSTAVQSAAREKLETALDAADERIAAELAGVEKELGEVAGGFSRLFGLLDAGVITQAEFAAENEKRRTQEETLTARQAELAAQLQQRRSRKAELDRAVAILRDIDALWDHMTPGERRQLLVEIDPRITARRDEGFTVVTIRPGFAEAIELAFVRTPRYPVVHEGSEAQLTRVQLAVLALWAEGKSIPQIARQREVAVGTVRWTLECIRKRLQVETLEEAYELQKETLARCRHTLVLEGRLQKRAANDSEVLTPALLEVLKLMAQGLGGTAIAKALGKDKSTISRQVEKVRSRLGVSTMAEAVARGRELGLVE